MHIQDFLLCRETHIFYTFDIFFCPVVKMIQCVGDLNGPST
jgi:hypothetical protein